MSKADVTRQWKPELRAFGFTYKDGMFWYDRGEEGHLDLAVSIQKNLRGETYKINPTLLFRNPLLADRKLEVVVMANLRADGIFLHVARSSWWAEEAMAEALCALKRYLVDWFHRVGRIGYLANVAETAIRNEIGMVEVIEPLDEAATTLPWLQNSTRRLGPMFFYQASVLHYLNGDHQKAADRTREWLATITPRDGAARMMAEAQLEALTEHRG